MADPSIIIGSADPAAVPMPAPSGDPTDMTAQYNTKLSADQEKAYQAWVADLTKSQGRDVSGDLRDYDMKGFFKSGKAQAENGHFTDEYKKPSHPTFSTESKYSGVDGNVGGTWKEAGGGKWTFTPGATNLKNHSVEGLAQYLKRSDPDVTLALPGVQ